MHKGKTGQGAAHGTKGGSKATPGNYGPAQQSASDKEAKSYAGKCPKDR